MRDTSSQRGFTLLELLVVISIIGLLGTIGMAALSTSRQKARDAKRLVDMRQVQTALNLYYDENENYPSGDGDGCGGWDVGNQTLPFLDGILTGYLAEPPEDPIETGNCEGYRYYRYSAGSYGCPAEKGEYFVLGIRDLEATSGTHETSPGWSCSGRNWQSEFEWVTGGYRYN